MIFELFANRFDRGHIDAQLVRNRGGRDRRCRDTVDVSRWGS